MNVEPGDTVEFTRAGERRSGRAWPVGFPPRLCVELPRDAVEVIALDVERDAVKVRKARKSRKRLMRATGINDFRPGFDRVVRFMGRAFAVSTDATYAAVEVEEPAVEVFVAALPLALTRCTATQLYAAVQRSAFLSDEGRRERLAAIRGAGDVRFDFGIAGSRDPAIPPHAERNRTGRPAT